MVKLKTLITEKQELNAPSIKSLAMLTKVNNHNKARLELAKMMKVKQLVKAYEAVMVLHDMTRQMNDLTAVREKLDRMLFYYAKNKYSNYDEIHGAF